MINFFSKEVNFSLKNKRIYKKWLNAVVVKYGFKIGDVNIVFCDDSYILEVNNEFLKHNYYTDIITFDYSDGKIISGELYISIDTVMYNAKDYNQLFENELNRVIVHGILHLCKLDDHTEKDIKVMRKAEDDSLKMLNSFFI